MNFQLARTNMIAQQIRPMNVIDEKVLAVLEQVHRENYVSKEYANLAYCDQPLPMGEGQMMLPAHVVGRLLQALNLQGHEKVLEIGTGTGYFTTCLAKLCHQVISIELFPSLLEVAQKQLTAENCRGVILEEGNGIHGLSSYAPYDVIVVTGAYPAGIPHNLQKQLNSHGKIVAFVGTAPSMKAVLCQMNAKKGLEQHVLFETVVPPLCHAHTPPQFQF